MTKKDTLYDWNDKCQETFEKLKQCLITISVLAYPNFKKTFYLYTDASGKGLGAVLAQKNDGRKEHVIAYASRSLNNAE